MLRPILAPALAGAVLALIGCAEKDTSPPPEVPTNVGSPNTYVTGKVTVNGKPIPTGAILLFNDRGIAGQGLITPDGLYLVFSVPEGECKVVYTQSPMDAASLPGRGGPGGGMAGMPAMPPMMMGGAGGPPGGPPGGGGPPMQPGAVPPGMKLHPGVAGPPAGPGAGPPQEMAAMLKAFQPPKEPVKVSAEMAEKLKAVEEKYAKEEHAVRLTVRAGVNTFDVDFVLP